MEKITIFDTSIATLNVGDNIIVEAAKNELNKIFDYRSLLFSLPTHEKISSYGLRLASECKYKFILGTNLLSSKYRVLRYNQWNIKFFQFFQLKDVVLMGVGWSNYGKKPNFFAKLMYKKVLSKNHIHSVRDNYTLEKLKAIGIKNVINTGCPTMWNLTKKHCSKIPTRKSENVVTTLTDYRKSFDSDKTLLKILKENYHKVYFWIQGSGDLDYVKSLGVDVEYIGPSLHKYDELLLSKIDLDYVGTRLHAGIRAIQKLRRTIIIGVDNRAIEKKRDFNLMVIERENINELTNLIKSEFVTDIRINHSEINIWKQQFLENE